MKIAFIGGGNMATALITGALRQGRSASEISVVEIDAAARERLERELKVRATPDMASGVSGAELIVLAVKPQQMREVAGDLAPFVGDALVVSIAAGIRSQDLSRWLGGHARIVRAMPNTPALVLAGMTGLYAPAGVTAADRAATEAIAGAAGKTLWLEREEAIDAVTAVSGSGPAYVFYFLEALELAAREQGFDADAARLLALQTFVGAVKLAAESPESAATLRARVTSKGGTTERAISELDQRAVRQAIATAVAGAAERSRELGEAFGRDDAGSPR